MLQRARELAVKGQWHVYDGKDLEAIANEMKELTEQIDKRMTNETNFNDMPYLHGKRKMGKMIQN